MDIDIIKEIVKERTDFWENDMNIHFVIYDRIFIKVFDSYKDFEDYVLADDFFMKHLEDPYIAVIENHFGEHRIIDSRNIKRRYDYIQMEQDMGGENE